MNWLVYLGGGIMWWGFWNSFNKLDDRTLDWYVISISEIAVWVWICWRVIR